MLHNPPPQNTQKTNLQSTIKLLLYFPCCIRTHSRIRRQERHASTSLQGCAGNIRAFADHGDEVDFCELVVVAVMMMQELVVESGKRKGSVLGYISFLFFGGRGDKDILLKTPKILLHLLKINLLLAGLLLLI